MDQYKEQIFKMDRMQLHVYALETWAYMYNMIMKPIGFSVSSSSSS
jgi:hypothetical protein